MALKDTPWTALRAVAARTKTVRNLIVAIMVKIPEDVVFIYGYYGGHVIFKVTGTRSH